MGHLIIRTVLKHEQANLRRLQQDVNAQLLTRTLAERAEDFCFFLSLAVKELEDTEGLDDDEVLTAVLNLSMQIMYAFDCTVAYI